jgi:lipopolysaccharide transport system permease protein
MAGLIEGFRSAFLDRPFNFGALALSLVVAVLIFIAGVAYFEKVERRFADIV